MKDFISASFKGRISSAPTFDVTQSGTNRATLDVAINTDYKNNGEPCFIRVTFFGQDADYVQRGFAGGKSFQVGSTFFVSNAKLNIQKLTATKENGKQKQTFEIMNAVAKTDNVFCAEKKAEYEKTANNNMQNATAGQTSFTGYTQMTPPQAQGFGYAQPIAGQANNPYVQTVTYHQPVNYRQQYGGQ